MTRKAVALLSVAILVLVVALIVIGAYLWTVPDQPAPRDNKEVSRSKEPNLESRAGAVDSEAVTAEPPKEVVSLLGQTTDRVEHLMRVEALPAQLSKEQVDALRWLLRDPSQNEALRNVVANRLRARRDPHLVEYLTEMLWDENETPKWRNYCIQQLRACYEENPSPAILDTLFKAAEADEKMVRICAVWSLARLATPMDKGQMPSEETLAKIRSLALEALREKDAHFFITEAGVQSCARLGLTEALPEIRALAERGHLPRIVISHDICVRSRRVCWGGWGFVHIPTYVVPMMQSRGFTAEEVNQLTIENPRRLLCIA